MTAGCTLTDVFACHCSVRLCWNGAFFMRGWLTIRRTFRAFCTEQGKTALLAQWDIERNLPLTPDDVTFGSHKRVWWTCPSGHSWQAMVYTRSEGASCPYCTGRKVTPKQGGLVKQFPALAAEWDDEKNAPLTPQDVTTGSHKLIWWRCPKGHSWRAAVYSRTTLGTGCPVCTGRQALAGENDLATLYPDIAAQWDEEKNGALRPSSVTAGSNRRVWWRCEKGHSYRAVIARRRLPLLRQPKGAAGVQRPCDCSTACGQAVAREPQRRADTGDGDCRKPQKSVVTISLRPHVESGHLRPHRRAAKRLPRLRREDQTQNQVNPARGDEQKIENLRREWNETAIIGKFTDACHDAEPVANGSLGKE